MDTSARTRNLLWGLAVALAVGVTIWAAPGVCSLLLASFIIAYVLAPVVDFLARRRLPRVVGSILVLLGVALLITGMLLLLVPVLVNQSGRLSERLPDAVAYIEGTLVPWVESRFKIDVPETGAGLAERIRLHLPKIGGAVAAPLGQVVARTFGGVLGVVALIANLVLIPIATFYLLRHFHDLWPRVEILVPRAWVGRVRNVVGEIDSSLAGFVRGQMTVALILGILTATGLSIVGIEGAIVIGLLSGFLNLVPYLGTGLGLTLSLLMAVLEFSGWGPIVGVLIVFAVAQSLEGYLITPRIVGDKVGLSPVLVILAILAGGEVFGFAGILLAVPGAAVLKVLIQVARETYLSSDAYAVGSSKSKSTQGVRQKAR